MPHLPNIFHLLYQLFTIGSDNKPKSLKLYVKLLLNSNPEKIQDTIMGIVSGETRLATGKTKLEDLFNNKDAFKGNISTKINEELAQYDLIIYNVNIEKLILANHYDANIEELIKPK
jgi:uncharacterized membrane protein YqiK